MEPVFRPVSADNVWIVEPARPRWPVDDVDPRVSVTVWPLITLLLILDCVLGAVSGAVLLGVCAGAGASAGIQAAVGTLGGLAVWIASWLRTSIRFTADELVVTMLLRPRRIAWARVSSVTFVDSYTDDDRPHRTPPARRVQVRYRRDLSTPTGPVPTTLGEYRPWARMHYRTLTLPLAFPPPGRSADPGRDSVCLPPRAPRTWFGRHASRRQQVVRHEFAARGYALPS